jgi:hypothetical protein
VTHVATVPNDFGAGVLEQALQQSDLRMIGLVLAKQSGTVTLWCDPNRPPPSGIERAAAYILIDSVGISVFISDDWQRVRWFTDYVAEVAQAAHNSGPPPTTRDQRRHWRSRRG